MITAFELRKLRLPLGRIIGDNSCAYDVFDVVALNLHDGDGLTGWGYGVAMSEGYFERTGWYIRTMPGEEQMRADFASKALPFLRALPEAAWLDRGLVVDAGFGAVSMALRQALWDLASKRAALPVWRLLGRLENRVPASPRVPAYGSLLDFPLNDEDAVRLLRVYLSLGLRMIKVKVGGPDPSRDLRRLQLVAQNAGPEVALIADANEAWDASTCIARMRYFAENGINLRYIEDPLPRQDLAGFRELRGRLPCPVAGHDYFDRLDQYLEFIEAGVIDVVRSGQNLEIQRSVAPIAHQRGLSIFYGNSIGELNIHAAAALPGTERIEYSHVAWSTLFQTPFCVQAGCLVASEAPGFGLDPSAEALAAYHCPNMTEPKRWPRPW